MNNAVLIGRLTRDPELRYIPTSGRAVTNFTLAVDRGLSREKRQEMEAKNQPTADFINVVVWGAMAENCAQYLQKGLQTAVQGRIQTGFYMNQEGKRVNTFEVVADRVEFIEWPDSPRNPGGPVPNDTSYGGNVGNMNPAPSNDDFGGISGFQPSNNDDDIPF